MKSAREVVGQVKSRVLRVYYLVLFLYHMRMYKRAVKNAEASSASRKMRGERDGS